MLKLDSIFGPCAHVSCPAQSVAETVGKPASVLKDRVAQLHEVSQMLQITIEEA